MRNEMLSQDPIIFKMELNQILFHLMTFFCQQKENPSSHLKINASSNFAKQEERPPPFKKDSVHFKVEKELASLQQHDGDISGTLLQTEDAPLKFASSYFAKLPNQDNEPWPPPLKQDSAIPLPKPDSFSSFGEHNPPSAHIVTEEAPLKFASSYYAKLPNQDTEPWPPPLEQNSVYPLPGFESFCEKNQRPSDHRITSTLSQEDDPSSTPFTLADTDTCAYDPRFPNCEHCRHGQVPHPFIDVNLDSSEDAFTPPTENDPGPDIGIPSDDLFGILLRDNEKVPTPVRYTSYIASTPSKDDEPWPPTFQKDPFVNSVNKIDDFSGTSHKENVLLGTSSARESNASDTLSQHCFLNKSLGVLPRTTIIGKEMEAELIKKLPPTNWQYSFATPDLPLEEVPHLTNSHYQKEKPLPDQKKGDTIIDIPFTLNEVPTRERTFLWDLVNIFFNAYPVPIPPDPPSANPPLTIELSPPTPDISAPTGNNRIVTCDTMTFIDFLLSDDSTPIFS